VFILFEILLRKVILLVIAWIDSTERVVDRRRHPFSIVHLWQIQITRLFHPPGIFFCLQDWHQINARLTLFFRNRPVKVGTKGGGVERGEGRVNEKRQNEF
jgi:hypothetical protein